MSLARRDLKDQLELMGSRVQQARRAHRVTRAHLESLARRGYRVRPDRRAHGVTRVHPESPAPQAPKVTKVLRE